MSRIALNTTFKIALKKNQIRYDTRENVFTNTELGPIKKKLNLIISRTKLEILIKQIEVLFN